MSGIVGIWNLDGRPVEKSLLSKLSATIVHRGPDGEGMWIQGPVGLACQLFRVTPESLKETQPLVHSSGTVIVFDGRLDNREELLTNLKNGCEISADSPDPALVLAAYDVFGDRFPEHLNGDFALGLFDSKRQQLFLVRDPIGVRPVYYCHAGETFLFASEIKALLAHPAVSTRPNDDTLAQFLIRGPAQNDHGSTLFDGVFNLSPAHMAILTPRGFVTRQYWDFDTMRRIRYKSFDEYAEAFRHHFEKAVRCRMRSAYPVAVSVSGGLDSSSILCVAETLRRRDPDSYPPIFGASIVFADGTPADERAYLDEIEQDYNITIEQVNMGQMGFLDGLKETMWHVEAPIPPSFDVRWNINGRFQQNVSHRGARVLLSGEWGDHFLFDQMYLVDLFDRLALKKIFVHLKEFSRWCVDVDPNFFRRRFHYYLIRCHIPDSLIPVLRKLRSKIVPSSRNHPWYTEVFRNRARSKEYSKSFDGVRFATFHAKSLYQVAGTQGDFLFLEWFNKMGSKHGLEITFPFLDRDLISFLMGIPGEMIVRKGVPKGILRKGLRHVIPDAIAERRWKGDSTLQVNNWMAQGYPEFVQLFQSDAMAVRFGYVREDAVKEEFPRLRERIQGHDCSVTWEFGKLLGLELWLQAFSGES